MITPNMYIVYKLRFFYSFPVYVLFLLLVTFFVVVADADATAAATIVVSYS